MPRKFIGERVEKMKEKISLEKLNELNNDYLNCRKNTIVRHALNNNTITSLAFSNEGYADNQYFFNIDIPTMTATNQKASGRCWIFAGLNVLREIIGNKLGIKDFELSQSYIAFYDRLEKINYELEVIIELLDKDHDDRVLQHVLDNTLCDAGQWDMFVNIVKKYGIVPQALVPETFQTSNTYLSNHLINTELRKFAGRARKIYKESGIDKVREEKDILFKKLYNFLVNCCGVMPNKFDFSYKDKNDICHVDKDLTPLSFFNKYFKDSIDDYVSIANAPTQDKPFNTTFTISYLGNVIEGKEITHLNLPIERLSELAINQLKNNEVTWFGSDCGKFTDKDKCIWDDKTWDYKSTFDLDYDFTKEIALDYKASVMNHAMVLTGVHIGDDGKPIRWKIENSWGTDKVNKGYYVMSHSWFERFVYQIVINKKYLNDEELKALEKKPIVLKPWDPMGALAN